MAAISKQYAREMHDKFGYMATWLPSVQLKLGDVGTIRAGVFEPLTSLAQLGITFASDHDRQAADLDYTSSDAVSIQTKASAELPNPIVGLAQAQGNISISFKRAEAVVFQASGCASSKLTNLNALGEEILARYRRGDWNAEHVVITDLITAKAATILISNSKDAQIDLALKAEVSPAVTKLADADVAVTRASGIGARIVAAKGLTPLFKVAGVRRRIIRDDEFARRDAGDMHFIELDYKELMDMQD